MTTLKRHNTTQCITMSSSTLCRPGVESSACNVIYGWYDLLLICLLESTERLIYWSKYMWIARSCRYSMNWTTCYHKLHTNTHTHTHLTHFTHFTLTFWITNLIIILYKFCGYVNTNLLVSYFYIGRFAFIYCSVKKYGQQRSVYSIPRDDHNSSV